MHEFDQMTCAGVSFFFMTSGFLVSTKHPKIDSLRQFYRRRLTRIFSLHWLALALMLILDLAIMHKFTYGWDFPLHITLLQSWIPSQQVFFGYSTHSWFLSSLMFAVLCTPLLLRWMSKSRLLTTWGIIAVACVALTVFCLNTSNNMRTFAYVFPPARLIDYTIGMALGMTIYRCNLNNCLKNINFTNASLIEVATIAIVAIFIAMHATGNHTLEMLETAPLWWIPMALLITTCTLLNGNEGIIGKVLTLKPLLWLGTISFEIYILQKAVNNTFCYAIAPLFGHFGILIYDYSFAATLPLLIVIAFCVNRYYTKPLNKVISTQKKSIQP